MYHYHYYLVTGDRRDSLLGDFLLKPGSINHGGDGHLGHAVGAGGLFFAITTLPMGA